VLIVDPGQLHTAAARNDRDHRSCVEPLSSAPRPILVPELVVTEVAYLLADRAGTYAEVAFGRSIADGELVAEPVLASEWWRVAELVERSSHLPLGMVDASVVILAERHGAEVVATLDRRRFGAVRPRHAGSLTLVP
jgi:predicted nucleic acid-binding protein